MVLSNTIAVCVAIPTDNEATRIRLCPAAFSLSLSILGGCRRAFQTIKVFIVGSESFDFGHKCCVGGGDRVGGVCEFLKHRLFLGGGVS